jgi:epoxyqueuosine reductase
LPDRTLDALRCISYLTIELKGAVPEQLPLIGPWVFGCDICQQVCPWNQRFASPGGDPAFSARPLIQEPDLIGEITLSQEDFSRKIKDSPVTRTKRRGYLRNVAIALGNRAYGSGDPVAVVAVAQALRRDPEALVRGHAAWALGAIGGPVARQFLQEAWHNEQDEAVREEIHTALARV